MPGRTLPPPEAPVSNERVFVDGPMKIKYSEGSEYVAPVSYAHDTGCYGDLFCMDCVLVNDRSHTGSLINIIINDII